MTHPFFGILVFYDARSWVVYIVATIYTVKFYILIDRLEKINQDQTVSSGFTLLAFPFLPLSHLDPIDNFPFYISCKRSFRG